MRKMKNSGVEWIGKIPSEWTLERLQWHLTEIKEPNNPIKTKQILSLTNKLGVIPYEEKGSQGNVAKENYDEYKIAYPNTIVANSMNVLIGSVGICNYFGCVSPVYYVLMPNKMDNLEFLNYIFQTAQFQKELRRYANGILEIRLRVSSAGILKRIVAFPSHEMQQNIVNTLNKRNLKIDALISNQEQQIEKLKQYKQSLITEVVTKGLNPDVPMKDSGVKWIGQIPENWTIKPLKSLFGFGKGLPITKENLQTNGVPVISYGQIHAKWNSGVTIHDELKRFVSETYIETNPNSLVKYGDFIFADTSEDREGCGNCAYVDKSETLFAGYHTVILTSSSQSSNKYLAYLFLTDAWRSQIRCKVSGIKVFSISRKILSSTSIILPDIAEQNDIVSYLDDKCAKIDRLIAIKQEKIDKLNDYKKSLIYEYVTGKKEA